MNKRIILALVAILGILCPTALWAGKTKAEKQGWRLAIQSYTFHKFTLMEALDKTEQLGIKYIEVYPGHKIGGRWGDQAFGPTLTAADRRDLRREAARRGIRIVGTGVYTGTDRAGWEDLFRLAREMRMEYLTCEPPLDMWDEIEALSDKYGIKVSVHNHPKPSDYWNPQNLLGAIEGRSRRLGSCADVGHWKREGLDPIACLRQLRGRVISLHFKDIAQQRSPQGEQPDVIWGTGCLGVEQMLGELKEQHFKGYLAIEYENNWDNSVPDIMQCLAYFRQVTDRLLR